MNKLSWLQVCLLIAYAAGMSAGQMLFKVAATSISTPLASQLSIVARLANLVINAHFIAAVSIYLLLSLVWVWILTFTPLSRAYPFVALAFVITPLLGQFFFIEELDVRFFIGVILVILGLVTMAT